MNYFRLNMWYINVKNDRIKRMRVEKIVIESEFITLGQLLKMKDHISSGGEARSFLMCHEVYVNEEKENRRGRKLYPGTSVSIDDRHYSVL